MMYLDDTLTEQELRDTRDEMIAARSNHNPANNPHGIPFAGEADARLIVAGDIIALYAGNDFPVYTVTIESATLTGSFPSDRGVTFQTTGGEHFVPAGMRVWVAAYAPLLDD